ncbi:hypothetical protein QJS10_CPA05g02448 [Acorus calamus]|uniref:Uncharacterized protein n=1 Tax=Acorus calamus TaxID=4465 RepID=A0AAV9EV11_ACOCL|nr:hypothetical protein QJS10_CPA05g02448 [Acorus calamus]
MRNMRSLKVMEAMTLNFLMCQSRFLVDKKLWRNFCLLDEKLKVISDVFSLVMHLDLRSSAFNRENACVCLVDLDSL